MARAISAAMVSFRLLLFMWTSQKFGEQSAYGSDATKANGSDDPVEQDLLATFNWNVIGCGFSHLLVLLHPNHM